jgi:hypothetical protein
MTNASNSILLGITPTTDAEPLIRDELTFKVIDVIRRAEEEARKYRETHKVNDNTAPFGMMDSKHVFKPGRNPGVPTACSCGAAKKLVYYALPFGYYISNAAAHYIQRHRGCINLAQMGRLNAFLGLIPNSNWAPVINVERESTVGTCTKVDEQGETEIEVKCGRCDLIGVRWFKPTAARHSRVENKDNKLMMVQNTPIDMPVNKCSWCGASFFAARK